jgi:putative membrane-bound dehydrogenase-like protein
MSRPLFCSLLLLGLCAALTIGADKKPDPHTAEAPLSPEEAVRTMVVPEGFQVTLFAAEPDVRQPTGFSIDDRGRLWVAEGYSYPDHTDQPARDRIVILEDTDGDGRHDKRTVFHDKLNYVTGIETGFGGAWVMSPPYFYFIPDRDGDDVPDSEPEVILDGFGNHSNSHNLANGFAWGPDGWLYGTHGRTNWSMIGKPGTPEAARERFDGGVWRYHPVRKVWEPYADGTTNPWGIDWDDHGQAFVSNCVNPHLFHVIQGAHYEPWRGRESSQHAYRRIDTIADHLHYTGGGDVRGGLGSEAEDLAGGGHAHCGTMVYLGDNWPATYRNGIFMNNIHGRRINHDVPKRAGSGYTASHAPDLMRSADPWFMGVTLRYGPGGEVYASDWSDTGECHSTKNTRKETGRIYRITWGDLKRQPVDFSKLDTAPLADLHLHRNDWHVRQARLELQERQAVGGDISAAQTALRALFASHPDPTRKLRALWTLRATGAADDAFLTEQLDHENEFVRGWSVQFLSEDRDPPAAAREKFAAMAARDVSPFVRLYLASALQRLPAEPRWSIAEALANRAEDANDQNLPLMLWYGVEPLVHDDTGRFVSLASRTALPTLRNHIARRVASLTGDGQAKALDSLVRLLKPMTDAARRDVFDGLFAGLEGRRSVPMPPGWPEVYPTLSASGLADEAVKLALIFDDPTALAGMKQLASDPTADPASRAKAVQSLIDRHPAGLDAVLLPLLDDPALAGPAIRGLAGYDHPETVASILARYGRLDRAARQDALQTLASRPAWASRLLDAVEAGTVAKTDLTAYTARQIAGLGDRALADRVSAIWGVSRPTGAEKKKQIARLLETLTPAALAAGDRSAGRGIFLRTCSACHTLFGEGGAAGPDLTGAQRSSVEYLLENIVDPSASVSKDFQLTLIETTSGRALTGFVVAESESSVTLQSFNEKLAIPAAEIRSRQASPVSMMPEGLLQILAPDEIRDLIAYLSGAEQAPLPQ